MWNLYHFFPTLGTGKADMLSLSLQAHIDEEVSMPHPMVLQSIQDRGPKISFGRRNLMVASQFGLGTLKATLTWRLYVDLGTVEASRLPCL